MQDNTQQNDKHSHTPDGLDCKVYLITDNEERCMSSAQCFSWRKESGDVEWDLRGIVFIGKECQDHDWVLENLNKIQAVRIYNTTVKSDLWRFSVNLYWKLKFSSGITVDDIICEWLLECKAPRLTAISIT